MIRYEVQDSIATLALARPKANALQPEMLGRMQAALDSAGSDPAVKALVLTSDVPRFFSAGFDVAEVFSYGRERMGEFLASYSTFAARLRQFPKPTLCSIPGHCFAGGTILALSCDLRIMAEGDFGIALNEIQVGVVLPRSVFDLAASVVGPGHARRMVLTGDPVPGQRALAMGLVDEVAAVDALGERTQALARSLAAKPAATYAGIKRTIIGAGDVLDFDVDVWFTPEAEECKRAVCASLTKK